MRLQALFACLLIGLSAGLIDSAASAGDAASDNKKLTLASIEIKGDLPETNTRPGLFADLDPSLRDIVARIDKAATDKDISAIVLRIRNPQIGRGKIAELRAAVAKARQSGKKIYADLQMALPADYLLATACDEIVMPESGTLVLPGVRAEVQFYKKLFEKVGIAADILQVGRYKGAGEPFTRSQMSPEFKAQMQSLIDDIYAQMVDTVAKSRHIDPAEVRTILDDGMFSPEHAKELKLIDRVAYEDEFRDAVSKSLGGGELAVINNYGKDKVDADFSGFGGLFKFLQLLSGQESGGQSQTEHKIAIVYAVGTIMSGESEQGIWGGGSLGGDTIVQALRTAEKDEQVSAIVLRVDSPGGSAMASDLMWREIVHCKKPIVASMGDVAASGGYYISMGTKKIFAEPGTLTGSIGVVGGKLAIGGLLGKVGITSDVISRGKNSGLFSINEPFTDSERAIVSKYMKETYGQFTSKAAEGRKMKLDKLQSMAEGRVFTGAQAKANGLVDEVGTLSDAIVAAKKLGGLPADEKVELLILPKPKTFFERLFDGPEVDESHFGQKIKAAVPELAEPLAEVESLRHLFQERTLTVLPFTIRIQ